MEGFGEKSWANLWDAIQRSRNTTFDRFLVAMDIPQVGSTASKALEKVFHGSLDEFEDAVCSQYDFTQLPDFGDTLNSNIREWFQNEENWYLWGEMRKVLHIAPPEEAPVDADGQKSPIAGMTIVVTRKVEPYTRDQINDFIVSKGGIAGSSVTKKTDCLICGENAGSKLQKARDLGKVVMTPAEFFSLFEPVA